MHARIRGSTVPQTARVDADLRTAETSERPVRHNLVSITLAVMRMNYCYITETVPGLTPPFDLDGTHAFGRSLGMRTT